MSTALPPEGRVKGITAAPVPPAAVFPARRAAVTAAAPGNFNRKKSLMEKSIRLFWVLSFNQRFFFLPEMTSRTTITMAETTSRPMTSGTMLLSPVFGLLAANATGVSAKKEAAKAERNVKRRAAILRMGNASFLFEFLQYPHYSAIFYQCQDFATENTAKVRRLSKQSGCQRIP